MKNAKEDSGKQDLPNRILDVTEKITDTVLLIIFVPILLVGLYGIIDAFCLHQSAVVSDNVKKDATPDYSEYVSIASLKEINSEIVAWLTIGGTHIDYPVTQAKDNNKYLTRNYKGEYAVAGSLFVDYRNEFLRDDYTVIYGHRMSHDQMLSEVVNFNNKDFFDAHPVGMLVTEDKVYEAKVMAYAVVTLGTTKTYRLDDYRDGHNADILAEFDQIATQRRDIEIGENDKLLLLSTCDKNSKYYRDVLLIVLSEKENI